MPGGLPADQLPLPERRLADDVEDSLRAEAEELPAMCDEEAAELSGQHLVATDAVATLPLGGALRSEAPFQGRTWAFETGRLARLANGSCLVQAGGTTVLAAATAQAPPFSRRHDVLNSLQLDVSCWLGGRWVIVRVWRPLHPARRLPTPPPVPLSSLAPLHAAPQVQYREKLYAVGRIPSTYNKREGAAKDHEVLAGRRLGRALRPLFPRGLAQECAVATQVLSADGGVDPDAMAVSAASAALMCSDLPFGGPVAAARVALAADGQLVLGPSVEQQEGARLNLLVACTAGRITMLEADGDQVGLRCRQEAPGCVCGVQGGERVA